jgi:hypothetical protein
MHRAPEELPPRHIQQNIMPHSLRTETPLRCGYDVLTHIFESADDLGLLERPQENRYNTADYSPASHSL